MEILVKFIDNRNRVWEEILGSTGDKGMELMWEEVTDVVEIA